MDDATLSLGELEIQALRTVWELQPCTERQVSDRVRADRDVARTTVLKTLQRLEEKGLLVREGGPGPVRFRASVAKDRLLPALVRRFVERFLGGTAGPLAAYLAEADPDALSADDLDTLRALVRRMEETPAREAGHD